MSAGPGSSRQPTTATAANEHFRTVTGSTLNTTATDVEGTLGDFHISNERVVQWQPEELQSATSTRLAPLPSIDFDQMHPTPDYGYQYHHTALPQRMWAPIAPQVPPGSDPAFQQSASQHAYAYPQRPASHHDHRYGQGAGFYGAEMPPPQAYPPHSISHQPHPHPGYRQSHYSPHPASALNYDPSNPGFNALPRSSPMVPPHYAQMHGRPPMLAPGSGSFGQFIPAVDLNFENELQSNSFLPTPSYPRGPPRKPKQSGFAIWVGNLSPGTTILELKDYFSRQATRDILSVFLISKSNCGFVNYKSAESAQAAVNRFHDSRFNGARLACRLRYGQSPHTTTPASSQDERASRPNDASEATAKITIGDAQPKASASDDGFTDKTRTGGGDSGLSVAGTPYSNQEDRVLERYFIVKSLTLQDLEASVRNGIWATQSHNESALMHAFESAQSVYLIFSANKSGEYFGYARMKSNIDPSVVTANPKAERSAPAQVNGPTSTRTPATESAPQGRVIDDSARGTIFWEADTSPESGEDVNEAMLDDDTRESSEGMPTSRSPDKKRVQVDTSKQDWGRPFQIEWLSTARVPFYRTRGLRNPWNSGREVKIARDGTELEPSVGRRLLDLFYESARNSVGVGPVYPMTEQPVVAVGSAYTASKP